MHPIATEAILTDDSESGTKRRLGLSVQDCKDKERTEIFGFRKERIRSATDNTKTRRSMALIVFIINGIMAIDITSLFFYPMRPAS
jgi:hypothetical protein